MCWGGYEPPSYPRGNEQPPCCGQEPTLRVRDIYVQYECRVCKRRGGLAITEQEAAILWQDES